MLDVQSLYTPSQIQDWYREDKFQEGKDRQYSLRLWIPWTRNTKIRTSFDLTKPRLAWYKQKTWKRHQDTVYWVDIQLAQRKGSKFYQTRCDAIILCDTLPAYCISKVVVMESGGIVYEKVYVSLRPPPTISFKDNWMKKWIQKKLEAARSPNESNPNQKPNYQQRGEPWMDENPSRVACQCL